MSLAYPVARSLEEAIAPGVRFARSAREAAATSPGEQVEGLETSWLHLPEDEARKLLAAQGAEGPAGHLQLYEDTSGHAVIAVNWWKLVPPAPRRARLHLSLPRRPRRTRLRQKPTIPTTSISAADAPRPAAAKPQTRTSSTCSSRTGISEPHAATGTGPR